MKTMVDEGKIGVRLWIMIRENNAALAQNLAKYRMVDYGGGHLTVRAIKHSIDGALGSRGAWLLEPYSDKPDSTGLNTTHRRRHCRDRALALQHDYQMCVHAIGDRANRETLDIFEQAFKANPGRPARSAVARGARAAPQPVRHSALRPAWRDRVDAGHPLHLGRAVRARTARPEAGGRRGVRLAEADEERRDREQWHRRARRGRRSDRELLRDRQPQDRQRHACSSRISE